MSSDTFPPVDLSESTFKPLEAEADNLARALEEQATKAAKITADQRLTPPAKAADLQALEAATYEAIAPRRAAALAKVEAIASELEDYEEGLRDAARIQPRTPDEWAITAARAAFAREDIAALAKSDPGRLLRQFGRAVKAGDRVTAFLLARYAPAVLEAEGNGRALSELMTAIAAAETPDAERLGKVKAARERAHKVSQRLQGSMTTAERRELAGRLGVRAEYMPA